MIQSPIRLLISLAFALLIASSAAVASRQPKAPLAVGLTEHLGDTVPLDLRFIAETGDTVALRDLVDRPTIVSLVYYTCPSICRPLLDEVAGTLAKLGDVDMVPNRDYKILTISFDQFDSAAGSTRLKDEYYRKLPASFPRDAWTFLTADSATIARFTNAVGFGFKRNAMDSDFAHPTSLIVLTPDGKISRYLLGAEYLPLDIKMALIEAREGRMGATIVKFYQFCFSYDPSGKKYVLNATRVVGLSTLIGVAMIVVFVSASGRRREKRVKKVDQHV
ncbi:MAG TPA: SCO family protein [Candidatus Krumholzibacteria bacterium]|nr:SCO family protein [Candidatus Krumholzibacteria bacterium]